MTLKITIKMDNAAFDEANGPQSAWILRELCEKLEALRLVRGHSFLLRDDNGNTVGTAKVAA